MPNNTSVPNINILSFKNQEETPLGKFLNWSLQYGRIIIIVTELLVITAFLSRFWFDRQLADLKEGIEGKTIRIEQSQGVEKEYLRFQQTLAQAGTIIDARKNFANVITNLYSIKPTDITISELTIKDNSMAFTAQAVNVSGFNTFVTQLTESKRFTDITVDDVAIKENRLVMTIKANLTKEAYL